MKSVTVRAPSSTANLGPGFDVFGMALDAFYDEVTLTKTADRRTSLVTADAIPAAPLKNTAGRVVSFMRRKYGTGGVRISIKKGVPVGRGMGSSAASAAAAARAFDSLYGLGLGDDDLVKCAGQGERASTGTVHYDNVAASVLGEFVIVRPKPFTVIRIKAPSRLFCCVAIPDMRVPASKTKVARGVIPKTVKLGESIDNLASAAGIVAGMTKGDVGLIGRCMTDVIVEPSRKRLIPGYDLVKAGALGAGAAGVTISGAGPSVIAVTGDRSKTGRICRSMIKGFSRAKLDCTTVICRPGAGARITRSR